MLSPELAFSQPQPPPHAPSICVIAHASFIEPVCRICLLQFGPWVFLLLFTAFYCEANSSGNSLACAATVSPRRSSSLRPLKDPIPHNIPKIHLLLYIGMVASPEGAHGAPSGACAPRCGSPPNGPDGGSGSGGSGASLARPLHLPKL